MTSPITIDSSNEVLAKALGKIASGVYILTIGNEAENNRQGMLASWVMQAGFTPPMLTVAMGKDREILKNLRDFPRCVINVVPEGANSLMGRFSKHRDDAFEGLETIPTEQGPALAEALSYVTANIINRYETGGDHDILLLEIVSYCITKPVPLSTFVKTGLATRLSIQFSKTNIFILPS